MACFFHKAQTLGSCPTSIGCPATREPFAYLTLPLNVCPFPSHLQGLTDGSWWQPSGHPPRLHLSCAMFHSSSSHTPPQLPNDVVHLRLRRRCHGPLQVYVNGLQCLNGIVAQTLFPASVTSRLPAADVGVCRGGRPPCCCVACTSNLLTYLLTLGGRYCHTTLYVSIIEDPL
ncbi:hypothetical protein LZ30DRAFT_368154 [Colletotrichum cereale]|nr:hypothetical protein LZ30DRAFT_368154 [Colletotrichum cereale]